jgi:hypothetical protein
MALKVRWVRKVRKVLKDLRVSMVLKDLRVQLEM